MANFPNDSMSDSVLQKALAAAEKGDNVGVVFVLKAMAENGSWQTLARIGELYETGGGNLEKNLAEAVKWYRRSVFECDDPIAHMGLGRIYYDGTAGVEQDYLKAIFHFQKAYINNVPQAGIYLGIMMYFGIAAEKNRRKAKEYFQLAADAGYFLAYAYLARIEFGMGHIIRGVKLAFTSWRLMARLTKEDHNDARLLGVEK